MNIWKSSMLDVFIVQNPWNNCMHWSVIQTRWNFFATIFNAELQLSRKKWTEQHSPLNSVNSLKCFFDLSGMDRETQKTVAPTSIIQRWLQFAKGCINLTNYAQKVWEELNHTHELFKCLFIVTFYLLHPEQKL